MTERVLDWRAPQPERQVNNRPYTLTAQIGASHFDLHQLPKSKSWTRRLWLDQGREGACTGFGAAHTLGIGMRPWTLEERHAFSFYHEARKHDEWDGEDYEGSSVLGACEALKDLKIIKGYWWITSPLEFKLAIMKYDALQLGTVWKSGMFTPDSDGYLHATGEDVGGHSYSVGAVDLRRNRGRIDNSWGKTWGENGSAWIDLDELFSLVFDQHGEAALLRQNPYNAALLPA